jgi:hypothetical protein
MEISKYLPNGDLIFSARGNSYIKMLNDFDNQLCDYQQLQVIDDTIKFTAQNPKSIDIDNYDEFGHKIIIYPSIEYKKGKPIISHYYTDSEYVPTYIGYHNLDVVSNNTLKLFNIKQPIVNEYDLQSNERILDKEYLDNIHNLIRLKKSKYIVKVPNIVWVYGKPRWINDRTVVDKLVPINTDDSDTDDSDTDDSDTDE